MLDSFMAVAYASETKKTAEATLMAKLRTMPDSVVEKIAFGPTDAAPKATGKASRAGGSDGPGSSAQIDFPGA